MSVEHISFVQYILVFIFAGIIGVASILDEGQLHRPLIACTIMGIILGNMTEAIIIGAALELLALGWNNIGAAIAPDAAIASVVTIILVLVAKVPRDVAISLAIGIASLGQITTIIIRSIVVFIQHAADSASTTGNFKVVNFYHYLSIFLYFLRVSVIAVIVLYTSGTNVVNELLNSLPEVIVKGLTISGGFIVVVGYAMILNMMRASHLMPFLFIGFTISAFTKFNLVGMGIIGVCIAILYITIHPKYNSSNNDVSVVKKRNKLDNQLD